MDSKQQNKSMSRKTWKTPKLIVHGDIEKITKEGPGIPQGFTEKYRSGGSL